MKLQFISLDQLRLSKANMRYARKAPDVSDILPTVRARGILQPILVRPTAGPAVHASSSGASSTTPPGIEAGAEGSAPGGGSAQYEIVAGCRRFHAAKIVAGERLAARVEGHAADGEPDPEIAALPCAVLDETDDAAAIEASLIENIARLEPDEVARWECFTRLVREGRSAEQIAQTFGLPDLAVRRVLALGNLLPRIREMYRREEIDAATIRHLTLASKSQQKAWLALVDDEQAYVPRGFQLKAWLFAGQSIPVRHALFDVAVSGLAVVTDLFGEDALFADGDAFWALQNAAIAVKCAAFVEAGWADAVVVPPDSHFHVWEYEKTPKRRGGRVYLDVRGNGEVIVHEGYLTGREAARLARSQGGDGIAASADKSVRPELTAITQTYIDLPRHAAVRAALLSRPPVALRLMVAHAVAGSPLWRVSAEPQAVRNDAIRESLDDCRGEAVFDERRRAVLALLRLPDDEATVVGGTGYSAIGSGRALCGIFARLLELSEAHVMDVLMVVMGETLASGTPVIEAVGLEIGVVVSDWWQADEAFFDTLRDREVLLAMVADVAGPTVAAANAGEKGKVLKTIVRDHLAGNGGRAKCEGWVPNWMAFPPSAYTSRGGVGTVAAHALAIARVEPDPDEDGQGTGCCDVDALGHDDETELERAAPDPDQESSCGEQGGASALAA